MQTLDRGKFLDLSLVANLSKQSKPDCKKCAQVDDLLHQVAELQELVSSLYGVKKAEVELDRCFNVCFALTDRNSLSRPQRRD